MFALRVVLSIFSILWFFKFEITFRIKFTLEYYLIACSYLVLRFLSCIFSTDTSETNGRRSPVTGLLQEELTDLIVCLLAMFLKARAFMEVNHLRRGVQSALLNLEYEFRKDRTSPTLYSI